MHGFYGRTLKIDLTRKTFSIDPVEEKILETFLGGKGLASYLLWALNPGGVDPLSAENCLIFATGPVCGQSVWGSSRYGVFTKSPQTGFYSESYAGGKVPEAIDATGFDAVVIQGLADRPCVLTIHPEGVNFHPAQDLWGLDTFETEDAVTQRFAGSQYKKAGAVVIGPAGENRVCFAVIENDYWRSAGRTGVGVVMGSKKLKAIVFQGDRKRPLKNEAEIRKLFKIFSKEAKENPAVAAYKAMGTPMMVKVLNDAKGFPTRYWSAGYCNHWKKISADALHDRCRVTPHACAKCFMACGRITTVQQGRHAGLKIEGPEYETIFAFGGLCMIDSIEEIAYMNDICDRLGMDTISSGNLCAFTIEAVKRNRIDYPIDYGDADAIADLLRKIAYREGIGDVLANGIKYAAGKWALEDVAVHVKGLEPAGYDPRRLKGMGLAYASSDRGACHLRTTFYKPELSGMIDPEKVTGMAALFVDFEDRLTLFDTLILCRFYRDLYPWETLSEIIHYTSGIGAEKPALQRIAANISNLVRDFNLREGMKPEDERLPRVFHRPLEDSGAVISEEELQVMLEEYHKLRGWTNKYSPYMPNLSHAMF